MEQKVGKLYLVATPLGNLEDITHRALRILNEVDFIAAEDTRHTLKLLNYFQIKKRMVSYYQHNERERSDEIITAILRGANVALVSDAGMPGISDPGNWIVEQGIKQGITIVPIPGASAVITALAASGLDTTSFWFGGFLPRKTSEQTKILQEMVTFKGTLVLYESPRRIMKTLQNIFNIMGSRQVVLARELTKIHEEFIRGCLETVLKDLAALELKGEFTILIKGAETDNEIRQNPLNFDTESLLQDIGQSGLSLREELREIGRRTGINTKELYQLYLQKKKNKRGNPSIF